MNNEKILKTLLYLCAFTFMHVKMRAPYFVCKSVAEKAVSDVK